MEEQSRRDILKELGLVAAGIATATPALANVEFSESSRKNAEAIFHLPPEANARLVDSFPVPIYDANHKSMLIFLMRAVRTPDFFQKDNDPTSPWPEMSFQIDKVAIGEEPHPQERPSLQAFFNELPVYTIGEKREPRHLRDEVLRKCDPKALAINFDMERLANRIARASRRGRGNLILYPYHEAPPPVVIGRWTFAPLINGLNEHVMMYRGSYEYDQAFFGVRNAPGREGIIYVPTPNWKDYVRRFRIAGDGEKNSNLE